MSILLESTKGKRLTWNDECNEALDRLKLRAMNSPRKMYDPVLYLRGNWCLVAVFDASDNGGGAALLLVPRACATQVDTSADLKPENGAILLDMYHKVWSGTQSRYQTYEQELFMMVKYIGKRSRYLAMAIAEHHESKLCKLGLFTDSTTAFKKWYSITVPQALLEHVSAVERRLLSWADKIAYTELWNMYVAHIPGDLNVLAHCGQWFPANAQSLGVTIGRRNSHHLWSYHGLWTSPGPRTSPWSLECRRSMDIPLADDVT